MIPCLYASTEMKFNHNGIGKLADAQSCTVTEKRNGSYELKLVCPADGIHAEMLEEGNIILAKPSDTMQSQPFRIYKITTPIDGKLEVQARHISYQLNFITVSPFSVSGCAGAMQGLKSHAASDCPFDVWTDVDSGATFTLGVPSSFRNCLGGMDASVLDTFGGEFEWDRYTVKFHKARGADHNVHIIYGKNLTDFKMEKSIENTITGVHPYWVDSETQAVMELPEKVVLMSKKSVPYQKVTVLDCTSAFQEKPTEAALREYAQNYLEDNSAYTQWCYKRDGAAFIARMLFEEATDINFFVGRAANPAHQSPDLPINFSTKMQIVYDLSECLKKMGKTIRVSYF